MSDLAASAVSVELESLLQALFDRRSRAGDYDLKLTRVFQLLEALGSPHENLPPVIHVAGTNGKGSTIAFLRALLEAEGMRVHVYTSPHLIRFNERIVLAGEPISDASLLEVLQRIQPQVERLGSTFFEATTVAAFIAFAEHPADYVILETGLGGRLDATNVVEKPALTVITSLSLDHMEYLGDTLAAIAGEKAAIMKRGTPCVTAKQDDEAMQVIQQVAADKGSPLFVMDEHKILNMPVLPLPGEFQRWNAALALTCLDVLGIAHSQESLTQVKWPARMQSITTGWVVDTLPQNVELWVDGGHNPAAGEAIASVLSEWSDREVIAICGMMKDKDVSSYLRAIAPHIKTLYAVRVAGQEERGIAAHDLAAIAKTVGISGAYAAETLQAAWQEVRSKIALTSSTRYTVLVCGSLYLAGDVLRANEFSGVGENDRRTSHTQQVA